MRSIAFVASGLAAGFFSGSLGVGGALLATPLIRFLGLSPYLAVGTTVPVLFPTTVTGAYTYRRAGMLDWRIAGLTALGGIGGAVGGALTTRHVNGHLLMLITAGVLLALSLRMLPESGEKTEAAEPRRSGAGLFLLGAGAGFFSGLLGIGGGFVMVPAFIRIFGIPIKTALGTSLAVISITAIPNMIAQQVVGNIDWRVALLLALGVIPGARIGALLSIRAKERTLRIVIGSAMAAIALVYAVSEILTLSSR